MTLATEISAGLTGPRYAAPPLRARRFTVDEYHKLIAEGFFSADERFELLEGWIVEKMSRDPIHDVAVDLADEIIRKSLPPGWRVRNQSAVTTSDSEPEPDIAVVRGVARDYIAHHPFGPDTGLIVEVSNSSLQDDREIKTRIYARAGVPVYWIINLIESKVEVYSDPTDTGFRTRRDYGIGQTATLLLDGATIEVPVHELLP